jgi:hypothetical protein
MAAITNPVMSTDFAVKVPCGRNRPICPLPSTSPTSLNHLNHDDHAAVCSSDRPLQRVESAWLFRRRGALLSTLDPRRRVATIQNLSY